MGESFKRLFTGTIVPFCAYIWIYLTCLTLRVKVTGKENKEFVDNNPCILAFWHSRIFYMPYQFRGEGRWQILVSPSADGDIINGVLRLFGFKTVRGSSFRHGRRALLTLARSVRRGASAAMIADGSRGPAQKAQLGSVFLSRLAGKAVVPIAYGAEKRKTINSWDRTIFPLPFSRVHMVFGNPITVASNGDDEYLEQKRVELELELNRVTALADSHL